MPTTERNVTAPEIVADHPREIDALREHHRSALRLMQLLRDRTEGLTTLSVDDVRILRDVFRYLVDFVDHYHHAREDLVVDALIAKDPAMRAHIEPFDQAHRRITRTGAALLRKLALLEAATRNGDRLIKQIGRYVAALAEHFQAEEAELFPRAIELLTADDWQAIRRHMAAIEDPIFGPHVDREYADLFDHYVNLVCEVGAPSPTAYPRAAAAVVDTTGAIIGGFKETIAAVKSGTSQSFRTSLSGAKDLMCSRSIGAAAAVAKRWARESRDGAATTLQRVSEVASRTRRSTAAPIEGAWNGTARQFAGSRRVEQSPPSWQAQVVNLALRATVKRMLSTGDVGNLRGGAPTVERMVPNLPSDIRVTRVELGSTYAEIFEVDSQAAERTILHLPGGGFLFPATQIHRLMVARLARAARARVMLVHYRLAPEHPFPAGLDDAVAAYQYLLDEGAAPASITICGDSAGGGLTLSTLLRLRDAGTPLPASAVLISPLADLTNTGASRDENSWADPMLPLDRKNNLADLYLRGVATDDPLVSPVFADMRGLPPMLVQVGSTEILLDDSLRIAARVRGQGGSCEVEVWHEMPHDWILIGMLPESTKAAERIARFIETAGDPAAAGFALAA